MHIQIIDHKNATWLQLLKQFWWNVRCCRRYDNFIERAIRRKALISVTIKALNVEVFFQEEEFGLRQQKDG